MVIYLLSIMPSASPDNCLSIYTDYKSGMLPFDERPLDALTLRIWRGTGQFTLYEDDGHTFEYKTGAFCMTTYQVRSEGQQIIVEIGSREGSFLPAGRETIVELVGIGEQRFVDHGTAQQLTFST